MEELIPAAIGAFVALATSTGERLLNRAFGKREKIDAGRDADVAMIEAVVFEVRDQAKEYLRQPGRNLELESSILGRLRFLSLSIDLLYEAKLECLRSMHLAINRFDIACTGGSFQTEGRPAEPHLCAPLELAAYTLVHRAKAERRKL